ncbi:MAG TPA: SGNH hydrolase domain-containing protein, partial [Erythrobacter sp.]
AARLRMMGKRVVIASGPVAARFDVGQCWARAEGGLPSMPPAPGCAIPPQARAVPVAWSDALFAGFAGKGATLVVRLDTLLCPDPAACPTIREGVPLYRDAHHLSAAGSALVGRRLDLGRRLRDAAR